MLMGRRLRELREQAGISVAGLAKQCKLDRTYIYDVENGTANWTIEHFATLLSACHSSLESFLAGLNSSDFSPEDETFHRMLGVILASGDDDLRFGIRINLEAISEKAVRVRKKISESETRQAAGNLTANEKKKTKRKLAG